MDERTGGNRREGFAVSPPAIALPKGGGAIRGLGESVSVGPTGSASLTIPIATSPGRGGFGPQLALHYESSAGNGPFGFGWSLGTPAITRKTDKGLPRYRDADASDVFLLAGADDLVPELDATGAIVEVGRAGYRVRRYRPRIEGAFTRIERWSRPGETYWRTISRDNVTSIYGRTPSSRIADPKDPARIFSWLVSEIYDDRGNAAVYSYVADDDIGVDRFAPHERHRDAGARSANRYLKRIRYGNQISRLVEPDLGAATWLFEVVFDYDEDHWEEVRGGPGTHDRVLAARDGDGGWRERLDAFSTYRPGFEVRTSRRCRRVLVFHHFDELGPDPVLVRSTELDYDDLAAGAAEGAHRGSTPAGSVLRRVTQRGHVRDETIAPIVRGGVRYLTYVTRALPPLELAYSRAVLHGDVAEVESAENLPGGADHQFVDLDGEGIAGVLSQVDGAWFYKPNDSDAGVARFAPLARLPAIPRGDGLQLLDLDGNGQIDAVRYRGLSGYHERTPARAWTAYRAFETVPTTGLDDPSARFVDLTGDGHADLLIAGEGTFVWHPSLGTRGFGPARAIPQPHDEDAGPRVVFADALQSIHLADMSGDGLADLVRIRNGEVCYWPNLGYGRFGAKVTMSGAPQFATPDAFDPRRLRLADIDGSGTTDILYLEPAAIAIYGNRAGNSLAPVVRLDRVPPLDNLATVQVVDLFGNGTSCLVWASPLAPDAMRPMRYIDLMGGVKPHLLTEVENHLGARTTITYAPSTKFYLADKRAGTPWITRLPFPVHCVERVVARDTWRDSEMATTYSYHHGLFDGTERELRGFARVEQVDVATFGAFQRANVASPYVSDDHTLYQPPVLTVTWYHTGAFVDREDIATGLAREMGTTGFGEHVLPAPALDPAITDAGELREALRACKGRVLRQEIYELDVDAYEAGRYQRVKLFSTASHACHVQRVQPRGGNPHAVFLATESEAITYHYDLELRTPHQPDPRVVHALNLRTDRYGNVEQAVTAVYPRRGVHVDPPVGIEPLIARVQGELHVAYTEQRFTNDVLDPDDHRLRVGYETLTYEVTGVTPAGACFTLAELRALALSDFHAPAVAAPLAVSPLAYHELPTTGRERRLVERARTLFMRADLGGPLGAGVLDARGLVYERYQLALTAPLLAAVLGARWTAAIASVLATPARSGYLQDPDGYWMRSGIAGYAANAADHFYLAEAFVDAFGNPTTLAYDGRYDLFVASSSDALQNTSVVEEFDYRVLAPRRIRDVNDNVTETAFDVLGLPTAVAVRGKGNEADGLAGFTDPLRVDPPLEALAALFTGTYRPADAIDLLADATARHVYYLGERREADGTLSWGHHPACAAEIVRERHVADGAAGRIFTGFTYSDGGGAVIVKKVEAEPAPGTTARRWIASGKVVLNNKQKPVKQYEPYFSTNEQRFEEPAEVGVTPILYYDALGRLVRTERADGTYSRIELGPWHVVAFDENDTVGEAGNAWYATRTGTTATEEQRRAAAASLVHRDTPQLTVFDSLGRDVLVVAHHRAQYPDETAPSTDEYLVTYTRLDAEGKPLWIRDPRGNLVVQSIQPPKPDRTADDTLAGCVPGYDIAGNLLFQHAMDAGDRWTLSDAAGKPMFAWDIGERLASDGSPIVELRTAETRYDALHRPTQIWLTTNGTAALVEDFTYGEGEADARARNLRGQLASHRDGSGRETVVAYSFRGKPLEQRRQLPADATAPLLDWQTATLAAETFVLETRYDALDRPRLIYDWRRTTRPVTVRESQYNVRGLVERVEIVLRATRTATGHDEGPSAQRIVAASAIAYDAKGQREEVRHGNGTLTRYIYDPETYRLAQLRTTRPGYDPPFPAPPGQFKSPDIVQNQFYTYDAAGNLVELDDDAFRPAFFANAVVEPEARYTYDSLNRLIAASGREHPQLDTAPQQDEGPPLPALDPQAIRNYRQRYRYDEAGNLRTLQHLAPSERWTRNFAYAASTNRLARTWLGTDTANAIDHAHDIHGNLLNLAQVAAADRLRWDHRDLLHQVERGGGGRTYYQYGSDRQRVRKVNRKNGSVAWERIYLGTTELYRAYAAGGTVEEIETFHVSDGVSRMLLVEDVVRSRRPDATLGALLRYQYANHLGSSCLELDANRGVISYEEYHPYGTSAFRFQRNQTEAAKRYRFTGMERDEESGLAYHGARYYAPWLARWTSSDPQSIGDGLNVYAYAHDDPVGLRDPSGNAAVSARLLTPEEPATAATFLDPARYAGVLLSDAPSAAPAAPKDPMRAEAEYMAAWFTARMEELQADPVGSLTAWGQSTYRLLAKKYEGPRTEDASENVAKVLGFGNETSRWLAGRDLVSADKVQSEWKQNTIAGSLLAFGALGRARAMYQMHSIEAAGMQEWAVSNKRAQQLYDAVILDSVPSERPGLALAIERMAWRNWGLYETQLKYGSNNGVDLLFRGVGENTGLWATVEAKPVTSTPSVLNLKDKHSLNSIGIGRSGGEGFVGPGIAGYAQSPGANVGLAEQLMRELRFGNVRTYASLRDGLFELDYFGQIKKGPF